MSEKLARQFHEIYERLAPDFGYETRKDTREFDPNSQNGRLMIAVTDEIEIAALKRAEAAEEALEKANMFIQHLVCESEEEIIAVRNIVAVMVAALSGGAK